MSRKNKTQTHFGFKPFIMKISYANNFVFNFFRYGIDVLFVMRYGIVWSVANPVQFDNAQVNITSSRKLNFQCNGNAADIKLQNWTAKTQYPDTLGAAEKNWVGRCKVFIFTIILDSSRCIWTITRENEAQTGFQLPGETAKHYIMKSFLRNLIRSRELFWFFCVPSRLSRGSPTWKKNNLNPLTTNWSRQPGRVRFKSNWRLAQQSQKSSSIDARDGQSDLKS